MGILYTKKGKVRKAQFGGYLSPNKQMMNRLDDYNKDLIFKRNRAQDAIDDSMGDNGFVDTTGDRIIVAPKGTQPQEGAREYFSPRDYNARIENINVASNNARSIKDSQSKDKIAAAIASVGGDVGGDVADIDDDGLIENSASVPNQDVLKKEMELEALKRKERVTRLQKILVDNGMMDFEGDEKTYDGIIGAKTGAAIKRVKEIQKMLGVKADGIIGKKTLNAALKRGVSIADLARHSKRVAVPDQIEAVKTLEGLDMSNIGFRKGGILPYKK